MQAPVFESRSSFYRRNFYLEATLYEESPPIALILTCTLISSKEFCMAQFFPFPPPNPFPNPPPNLQQNILNELRRLRRNGMPMNLNMNNIPEPSSSAAFKIMLGIHGAGILASFVTMPLAIASRAASEWINSFFSTKAVVDKLKAATKFELKKIAAEKASELAKIAANQQGRQALLRKGVLGGIGLLGSGGLAVAGTYGVKSLTESRTAWAKAEAEVWAEAQKIEEQIGRAHV